MFLFQIKGFDFDGTKTEVNHILGSFDLEIRKNLLVSALSPTLQRRLSVAIALIGESEVYLLLVKKNCYVFLRIFKACSVIFLKIET